MKRRIIAGALAALLIVIALFAVLLSRERLRRRRVFRTAAPARPAKPPTVAPAALPQWSDQFRALETGGKWGDLVRLLDRLERANSVLYAQNQLAYLHARALIENDDPRQAAKKLAPYLAAGNPFRDLALFHQAEIDEARNDHAAASRDRQALIFGYNDALYRDQAIDDETDYLSRRGDPKALGDFAARLYPKASPPRRRDLDAHLVELLARRGDTMGALQRGTPVLRNGTLDDAADRVSRAFDRSDVIRRMTAEQQVLMGQALFNHRHFDRAEAVLTLALRNTPRDDLLFALGRSYFGDEKYAQAQQTYLRGANSTRDPRWKSEFLWHAARSAQLQGDDATAERLMTAVIAAPGRSPAMAAAATQRLRTRLKQRRVADAAADLNYVRKSWPRDHAVVEASLAYALGLLGMGNTGGALSALNSIPRNLLDKFEPYEIDYWRARALENSNPQAAFAAYLNVLRATMPTHFAYFARQRLDAAAMAPKLSQELARRDNEIAALLKAGKFDDARRAATDRVLLSSSNHQAELQRLAEIYKQIPAYRSILELQPHDLPHFPLPPNADRMSMLMAMGLYDEAADDVVKRYPLQPAASALTRSLALNRGSASRDSIFAIEVLMKSVPDDYVPELLPLLVRELLYPRYFYGYIVDDSKHFNADPTLVLSIMREESRFNPRAKSEAAARGLLQFIITTATEIGRDIGLVNVTAEDLYDPRVVIRLGARYVSTLSRQFGNDQYQTVAAYNAGPHQVALWGRLAPGAGDDFFLSAVSFDETKQYVRKVMNSYKRYAEIYGNAGPQGGIRMEP